MVSCIPCPWNTWFERGGGGGSSGSDGGESSGGGGSSDSGANGVAVALSPETACRPCNDGTFSPYFGAKTQGSCTNAYCSR